MHPFIIAIAIILPVFIMAPFLGRYVASVVTGNIPSLLAKFCGPVERSLYRLSGIREEEQTAGGYAKALLCFNAIGIAVVLLLLLTQSFHPLNPEKYGALPFAIAWNTAVSFITNTNWQTYQGEVQLSYLSQIVALGVQLFLSSATGIAVLVALIRGFTQKNTDTIGNYYVDMVRITLYILLPLSLIAGILLIWQGVPQNLQPYVLATTLEGETQRIAQGPVASFLSIKMLGSNGGGFFNANSAHPYENPTAISWWIEMWLMLILPMSLPFTYGAMVKDHRQSWTIFSVMLALFFAGTAITVSKESSLPASFNVPEVTAPQGSMEGKELRFGSTGSSLWAEATTATSNGSVASMHESMHPLTGFVALSNMLLGEVIFGGVGSGLYGMLLYVILAVFIAGLMVGRSPELLGKKIESHEMKLTVFTMLIMPIGVLLGGAAVLTVDGAQAALSSKGAAGLTELLYALTSATANNGSGFAAIQSTHPFYVYLLSGLMLLGRFGLILPVLSIAGSLSSKQTAPASSGTFPTHGVQFAGLLGSIIVMMGGLTFFPILILAPLLWYWG